MTLTLRLGHPLTALRPALHNGPGWRIGLWVQGCVLRCTRECLSPHLLDPDAGLAFPIDDVTRAILDVARTAAVPVEGLTVLGGEPTEQAAALHPLFAAARAAGLSTMLYSGHTLENLQLQSSAVTALLALTDLLVDGPYLPEQSHQTLPWRGSANQRLIPLSARYDEPSLARAAAEQGKAFSFSMSADGSLSLSGLQERGPAADLARVVRRTRGW